MTDHKLDIMQSAPERSERCEVEPGSTGSISIIVKSDETVARDAAMDAMLGYVDLELKHDVKGELKLKQCHIDILGHIVRMDGEIRFDWSKIKPESREVIADMIQLGLVREPRECADQDASRLKITAKGSNIYDESLKTKIVATETKLVQMS